ncbi:MAG TPA: DUF3363 domain-containing protein [Myxococcota bacterium]|nr:DUF3363 domain-containing protein [Myxococcota bacterium]
MTRSDHSNDGVKMHLRPRRPRHQGGGPSALRLRQVRAWLRGGRRSTGARLRRVPRLAVSPSALQRSIVKVRYVANRGSSHWRAHGRYLARENAQEPGRPGLGFDAQAEEIGIASRLGSWQGANDPRLWKLIVSPEEGQRMDLRHHARELVATLEGDLGVRLEWLAIEHHDTAHPHLHIVVRGRDGEGQEFRMPRQYVAHGIRTRSQELATRALGLRSEHDRALARERGVEARHFGILDRMIDERADGGRTVAFDAMLPASPLAREVRLQMLRRLEFLTELGLAERTGKRTWRLSEHHRPALRQMQLVRDLQRSLTHEGRPVVEPGAPQRLSSIRAGVELQGRFAGVAFDEVAEVSYLVLEGTDGITHFVRETPEIAQSRGRGELQRDQIVTLRGRAIPSREGQRVRVEIAVHGPLPELEAVPEAATILDLAAARSVRETGEAPAALPTRSGFFAGFREAVARRIPLLERQGLVYREHAAEADAEQRITLARDAEERIELAMKQRERQPLSFAEAARLGGKPIEKARLEAAALYRGRVVAAAMDDAGESYLVLDTGRSLTAVPAGTEQKFPPGREVRAIAELRESGAERRRILRFVLEDMEREQKRERGRER